MIDTTNKQILTILQDDARTSNAAIGREIGLAPSAVLERIRRLQTDGVVRAFRASVDRDSLGYRVTAFVEVRTDAAVKSDRVAEGLARIPEVLEIHDVAGDACFLLKVVARDIRGLHVLINERIGAVANIRSTSTTIVLKTFKETTALPVGAAEEVN